MADEDARTLHVRQGFTYRVTFTWTDESGAAISLADYDATFRVLSKVGVLPAILTVVSPASIVVEPDGETGQLAVTLTASQTAALPKRGAYALGVSPSGDAEPIEYVASGPIVSTQVGA